MEELENFTSQVFEYIVQELVPEEMYGASDAADLSFTTIECDKIAKNVAEYLVKQLDESFGCYLQNIIAKRGLSNQDVYKRAKIGRRLFSHIICDKNKKVSKETAFALGIGLKLNLDEFNEFLKCAGFAINKSQKLDLVYEFFIKEKKYDMELLKSTLYKLEIIH